MDKPHPLRAYRTEHGLSCVDLGKKLGIAASTVRSFENGNRVISAETAVEIEKLLGIERSAIRADLWKKTRTINSSAEQAAA